jgi:excisionase family DNA binding protein
MLQYYTLEEAANVLGVGHDRAKKLLDDHKVRQYRDGRGGVRYVASAVDELARSLGRGSDPELPLGEAPRPKSGGTPRPSKVAKGEEPDSTFEFDLPPEDSADVGIGAEKLGQGSGASKRSSGRGKSPSPKSPAPKAGSDSDVRLVTDGSDLEFQIAADSDVKMVDEAGSSSKTGAGRGSKAGAPKSDKGGDSEVRIVPLDIPGDSDVKISDDEEGSVVLDRPPVKKHSDSDIRLEEVSRPAPRADEGSDDALVTEEIDLDAEERKAAERAKAKGGKSRMKKADKKPPLPTQSPFELSDSDLDAPPAGGKKKPDSSSDFELTPGADMSDSSIELSESELGRAAPPAQGTDDSSDEEVALGEIGSANAGNSGINLDAPMDSGISLEGGEGSGDEMEFELSLDAGSTPKPGQKSGKSKLSPVEEAPDSDSEFELTLDSDSSVEQPVLQPAAEGPSADDSDSEFELTLDDSGGLVPMEAEQAQAPAEQAEEGDIFETDFEVPAIDEESGSEAVALDESDTDLESSDFDLALEEGDAAADEESGSQVVALEDEEAVDEAAETVQKPKKKAAAKKKPAKPAADEESGDEDLGEMLDAGDEEPLEDLADVGGEEEAAEEEEEAGAAARAPVAAAAPAPWGPVPALVLLPCVIVMLLAGLMGYELINGMLGYQQPGKVSGVLSEAMAKAFDLELPKE